MHDRFYQRIEVALRSLEGRLDVTSFIAVKPWPAKFENVANPGERLPLKPGHAAEIFKKFAHV